jgi:hypothetical protein
MITYIALTILGLLNIFLGWYLIGVLRKLLYISDNIADLYLLLKSFQIFVEGLYSMSSYNGEPIVQELMVRTKEILVEVENFREVFQLMLDEELEEELNAVHEAQNEE